MTATRKVLGQQAPPAGVWTTLYTCASAGGAIVSCLSATNRTTTDTKIRVAVRPAGAVLADKHYELYDFVVPGNDRFSFVEGITLANTDVVAVWCEAATISFGAFGQEFS